MISTSFLFTFLIYVLLHSFLQHLEFPIQFIYAHCEKQFIHLIFLLTANKEITAICEFVSYLRYIRTAHCASVCVWRYIFMSLTAFAFRSLSIDRIKQTHNLLASHEMWKENICPPSISSIFLREKRYETVLNLNLLVFLRRLSVCVCAVSTSESSMRRVHIWSVIESLHLMRNDWRVER